MHEKEHIYNSHYYKYTLIGLDFKLLPLKFHIGGVTNARHIEENTMPTVRKWTVNTNWNTTMTYDLPSVSYMALYIVSMQIVNSNSRSSAGSNHWKLSADEGRVIPGDHSDGDTDDLMNILTNKVVENGEWRILEKKEHCDQHRLKECSKVYVWHWCSIGYKRGKLAVFDGGHPTTDQPRGVDI